MSSRSSSSATELTTAKILAWSRGLETFERMDFVYLLMHSLFPTELRYIHGIIDGLLKRDESLYTSSIHQANDFARLSHFYEGHDPQSVIGNDGLRRQFIVDLSALHPLNFCCADIFFGVLQRAELKEWTFSRENQKLLRELILITTMVARHAAFRFDNRLYVWNIARALGQKLKALKMAEEGDIGDRETEEHEPMLNCSNSDPIELHSTLTTSGADRLPNGYSEAVFVNTASTNTSLHSQKSFVQAPSVSAFPPLSALTHSHQRVPASDVNAVSKRPKSTSSSGKVNDIMPTGNSAFRNSSEPSLDQPTITQSPQLNLNPERPTQRANSVEFVNFNHCLPNMKITGQRKDFSKENRRHVITQRSVSPNLIPDSAADLQAPSSILEAARVGEPVSTRNPPLQEVVLSPAPFDVWRTPAPFTVNRAGIRGQFPMVYTLAIPNGPRFPQQTHIPYANPQGSLSAVSQGFPRQNLQKPISCYNCGISGHYGEACPKKKPMDSGQAEKYCALQRDAKLYPEKGRPSFRQPGPHS